MSDQRPRVYRRTSGSAAPAGQVPGFVPVSALTGVDGGDGGVSDAVYEDLAPAAAQPAPGPVEVPVTEVPVVEGPVLHGGAPYGATPDPLAMPPWDGRPAPAAAPAASGDGSSYGITYAEPVEAEEIPRYDARRGFQIGPVGTPDDRLPGAHLPARVERAVPAPLQAPMPAPSAPPMPPATPSRAQTRRALRDALRARD